MLESMSDKAVLEHAIHGDLDAVTLLARRFGYKIDDPKAVQFGLKRLSTLSVNACKRIIASNAVRTT